MSPHFPPLNCPRCGMVDRVQKVSALVAAGTSTSVTTGHESDEGKVIGSAGSEVGIVTAGRMRQEGSQQTRLSKMLSLPAEPPPESPRSAGTGIAAVALSAFAICSLTSAGAVASITGQADISACGVLLALAADVVVVVLLLRTRTTDKRLEDEWQAERDRLKAAKTKWEKLYYCWRDDVVFDPEDPSGTAIPVTSMWDNL
jgi:hypothetical protein